MQGRNTYDLRACLNLFYVIFIEIKSGKEWKLKT